MKKFYFLLATVFFTGTVLKGQDTLLFENFQNVMTSYLTHTISPPPANVIDAMWYDYDADQLPDGSGSATARKDDWYQILPFANADLYTAAGFPDTNIVMGSNSWLSPAAAADNWLITPNIKLGAADTLFWKSAPRQTPRYLDGYEVKISTTTNDDLQFTTVLMTFAEMTAILGTNDSVFSGYTFSPGFVHGQDGTYFENQADSARLVGKLRPFSVPLNAYANKNVFIAFHHNSFDDNLISIDDIMIRGTLSNPFASVYENQNDLALNLFPNPATENVQVNYTLSSETIVTIDLYDVAGRLVATESKGEQVQGRHFAHINTADLSKGFYTVKVSTSFGQSTSKLIVR